MPSPAAAACSPFPLCCWPAFRRNLALGTNKGQSVFGSGTALSQFWGTHLFDRRRAMVSIPVALVGAALGVLLVSRISPGRPRAAGDGSARSRRRDHARSATAGHPRPPRTRSLCSPRLVAFTIAAYDGFFGPGTGTFLILAYAYLWRDPLDAASANAKAVNFASNLASLAIFASAA